MAITYGKGKGKSPSKAKGKKEGLDRKLNSKKRKVI
jgi:hypothetical protein